MIYFLGLLYIIHEVSIVLCAIYGSCINFYECPKPNNKNIKPKRGSLPEKLKSKVNNA